MEDGWLIWSILPNYVSFDGYFYDNDFPNMSNVEQSRFRFNSRFIKSNLFYSSSHQPAPSPSKNIVPVDFDTSKWCRGEAPPVLLRLDGLFFIVLFNLSKFPSILYGPLSAISSNHIVEHQWKELYHKEKCKLYISKVEISPAKKIMDSQLNYVQKGNVVCRLL